MISVAVIDVISRSNIAANECVYLLFMTTNYAEIHVHILCQFELLMTEEYESRLDVQEFACFTFSYRHKT